MNLAVPPKDTRKKILIAQQLKNRKQMTLIIMINIDFHPIHLRSIVFDG